MTGAPPHGRTALTASARAVFGQLTQHGPATRPALGAELGLSKPTMSVAVSELTRAGLITAQGAERGQSGRPAERYSVASGAGHVLGLEIAATRVRVAAHTLDGQQVFSLEHVLAEPSRTVTGEVAGIAAQLVTKAGAELGARFGPLREVALAAPTLQSVKRGDELRLEGSASVADVLPGLRVAGGVESVTSDPDATEALVVNNVNCAAVAEHRLGAAVRRGNVAYVQVGVKIGLGLLLDGRVVPGHRLGAGELALLPFPWSPRSRPERGALEQHLGSDALVRRCRAAWRPARSGPAPRNAEELFEAAARGDRQARTMVEEHARDIGRLVSAVVAVVDPELVVLGGGVGQHPLVLGEVRRTVAELTWDTEVVSGALHDQATVLGAVHLAIDRAVARLLA